MAVLQFGRLSRRGSDHETATKMLSKRVVLAGSRNREEY
jgi:hypothetical protein